MTYRLITAFVIIAFVVLAVFGLYLPAHVGHEMTCPFSSGETAICASPLSHLAHWQTAFVAVLIEFLVFVCAALVFFFSLTLEIVRSPQLEKFRLRERIPIRPPLFQELYSQGILNRRELQM